MIYLFGVVLFALAICVSIALHEAGHMLTAKWFGMKVRRYFVGFGPKVFSFRRGETEYGLKAIPLGGFCDIAGMTALDEVTPEESKRAMWRYPVWKRTVVLSAGSITHFLLGFIVLYLMAATMGLPNIDGKPYVGELSCAASTQNVTNAELEKCTPEDPSPAKDAGMRTGDEIVAINGKPMTSWDDVLKTVRPLRGENEFTVLREDQRITLNLDVAEVQRLKAGTKLTDKNKELEAVGAVGMGPQLFQTYGPVESVGASVVYTGDMFVKTWDALLRFPERIPAVVDAIFGAERSPDTPVSVVGASRLGGEAAELGVWWIFLMLIVSLNFFVGVFNLLPLLPLDGGHIAVTWYEKVRDFIRARRGKAPAGPVDYNKLSAVTMVLVFIGGAVVLLTVTADIVNPIRLVP